MKFETIKDNKKRIGIILSIVGVIAVIGITAFTLTRASYKQTQSVPLIKGNISYNKSDLEIVAIKLQQDNGIYSDATEVPSSGYKLNTDIAKSYCKVGSTTSMVDYKFENGKHYINVTEKGSKCYLTFDKFQTASEYLISKNEMVQENGYRYEGKSPNNYVTFNNELWRIIGVFDVETDKGDMQKLVKIIRNENIGDGELRRHEDPNFTWKTCSLKSVLNSQYYMGETIYQEYYNWDNYSLGKFKNKSLNEISRNMIQSVKWLTGVVGFEYTVSDLYLQEKSATSSSGYIWAGNIGLMYPSDYGYAADPTKCPRTTLGTNYNLCTSDNWLYIGNEWTLNEADGSHPKCSDPNIRINNVGSIECQTADYYNIVRPTIYLKQFVSILDNGKDGSQSKPYDLVL